MASRKTQSTKTGGIKVGREPRANASEIFVFRMPATVKAAVGTEAEAAQLRSDGAFIRQAVGEKLQRLGYELAPETAAALHL